MFNTKFIYQMVYKIGIRKMKRKSIYKRFVSLFFIFLLLFTNLSLFSIKEAQAAITLLPPTAGSCQQNSGTGSANNYIYPIGTIQISSENFNLSPGLDDFANTTATTGNARATRNGSISTDGDVIGNVFSIVPPSGAKFVILSGKEDSSNPNNLAQANVSIFNSLSQDSMGVDNSLGISVGVVTTGTAGVDRVIVAVARDADTTGFVETYPKSGTGSNTAVITITGLGLSIPPSGSISLSGTLSATVDLVPPTGIGKSGGIAFDGQTNTTTVNQVLYSISSSNLNLCSLGGSSSSTSSSSSSSSGSTSSTSPFATIQTTSNSNDTCTPVSGTSIYPVSSIQLTAPVNYFSPGPDDSPTTSSTIGNARAVNNGRISTDGDVIGNVFSLTPPSGAKFVILPGFENPSSPTLVANSNATISNAYSQDSSTSADGFLGISVGVVINGSAGNGRAIVAIARDADGATTNNYETFPKSNTGSNTATIMINGLGIQFDPGVPISGILQVTPDNLAISGIGRSGGSPTSFVASVLPLLPTTPLSICNFGSALTTTSSSSGSITSTSSSSSGGFTTSSSGSISTSSSGSTAKDNCPPCLVSGSKCPTNCPEKLINCDGVAYLNICDYQRIKCGCFIATAGSSTSGGTISEGASTNSSGGLVSSTSSSGGGGESTLVLNNNFSGIWKGVAKLTSSSGKKKSKLAVLNLCVIDNELEGTVNVSGIINNGEIISQNTKSENEVDIDIVDKNENIRTLSLKLSSSRRLFVAIEDAIKFIARKIKTNRECLQPSLRNAHKQKKK